MQQSCERINERAGAAKKKDEPEGFDQAIGRSRGGLSTKIHATCDALGAIRQGSF